MPCPACDATPRLTDPTTGFRGPTRLPLSSFTYSELSLQSSLHFPSRLLVLLRSHGSILALGGVYHPIKLHFQATRPKEDRIRARNIAAMGPHHVGQQPGKGLAAEGRLRHAHS
ncbi:hypothetical protein JTE90_000412 [Oedothorax gibbosus]|uniref:Uncharacterized protein n=1 Tax=Oedothorax gibbosus TaxID=931172 RepID=A0AAV6TG56_9ARAC|nr:hypothetical protein JTE90_000412 [Oedothorax gibbosus]